MLLYFKMFLTVYSLCPRYHLSSPNWYIFMTQSVCVPVSVCPLLKSARCPHPFSSSIQSIHGRLQAGHIVCYLLNRHYTMDNLALQSQFFMFCGSLFELYSHLVETNLLNIIEHRHQSAYTKKTIAICSPGIYTYWHRTAYILQGNINCLSHSLQFNVQQGALYSSWASLPQHVWPHYWPAVR